MSCSNSTRERNSEEEWPGAVRDDPAALDDVHLDDDDDDDDDDDEDAPLIVDEAPLDDERPLDVSTPLDDTRLASPRSKSKLRSSRIWPRRRLLLLRAAMRLSSLPRLSRVSPASLVCCPLGFSNELNDSQMHAKGQKTSRKFSLSASLHRARASHSGDKDERCE